jgi:hypothetical protein
VFEFGVSFAAVREAFSDAYSEKEVQNIVNTDWLQHLGTWKVFVCDNNSIFPLVLSFCA